MTGEEKLITLGNLAHYDSKIKQYIQENDSDSNTTYSLSISGDRLTLQGSDSTNSVVTLPSGGGEGSIEHISASEAGGLQFFDGEANAQYSIAAGTNDKAPISGILGTVAAAAITVNNPTANGIGSIAFGGGAETKASGGQALGVLNTSGVKGFYWDTITFNSDGTATIKISSTRRASTLIKPTYVTDLATTYKWAIGDTVSIVNDNQYAACATITAISSDTITVDSLPFTSIAYTSILSAYTYVNPDDRTIFACYQKQEANISIGSIGVTNSRWYPREGTVELGWAATQFGVENFGSGAGSLSAGFHNWQAGNFGATFGRDNIGGYCGVTVGGWNKNLGLHSAVVGRDLVNNGDYNLLSGRTNTINNIAGKDPSSHNNIGGCGNTISGHRNIIGGSNNTSSAMYNTIINGSGITASDSQSSIFIGDSHKVKGNNQAIFGLGHEIISGSCNFISGRKNTAKGNSNTIIGGAYDENSSGNSVYGIGNIVGGTNNKAGTTETNVNFSLVTGANNTASHVYTYVLGRELKTSSSYQLVVGSNNSEVANTAFIVGVGGLGGTPKNGFVVYKDGRATVGKAPTNDMDVATKQYVDSHSSGVDEDAVKTILENVLLNGVW